MAKLPTVSSDIPRDLRQFVDRVREAMNGTGQDEIVTVRKLVASGVAAYNNGGLTTTGNLATYSYPPAPNNVTATGALANVMLTWDKPIYTGHAYAEIWAAEALENGDAPAIGDAELIGMAPGTFFAHNLGAAAARWYWVRFVNLGGEVGPYNATDGIQASTGQDAEYLLQVLTGEITQDQLYSDLSTRVDRIDTKTRVFRQETEPFYGLNPDGTLQTGSEAYALVDGDIWIDTNITYYDDYATGDYSIRANRMHRWDDDAEEWVDFMDFGFQDWFTAINTEKNTRQSETGALADRVDTLETAGYVDSGFVAASISNADTVSVSELNGAIAQSRSQIEAIYDGKDATTRGLITDEEITRAGETSALAGRLNTIEADYVTGTEQSTAISAAIQNADTVTASELGAVANSVTTLEATLTDPGGTIDDAINAATAAAAIDAAARVQVEADARISADGEINSKYTVKLDSGGHVSGFGLLSSGNVYDGSIHSQFGITANEFFIAPPVNTDVNAPTQNVYPGFAWLQNGDAENYDVKYYTGSGWSTTPQNLPFVVRSSPTTINGVSVPAGVYMQDAFIANGTITNAKIGNAAIDDAKITSLDAGKITTGYLNAGRIAASSITAGMIDSRGLSIKDANGNIILAAGSPLTVSNVSGLGTLATADNITMSSVTDAGELATKNTVPTVTNFTAGEELYNGTHEFVDINGYPAGILCAGYEDIPITAALGTHDRNADLQYSDISSRIISFSPWNTTISTIYYPAFKVNPSTTYTVTVRMKTNSSGSVLYGYGLRSSNVDLTSGNTVVGDDYGNYIAEDGIQDATRNDVSNNNQSTRLSSFVDKTFTYNPQPDAQWASVYLMCQSGTVYVERVSVVNNATVGATFDVNISGQITSTNVSTYIANAAIGNAQIQNATIDVAKIDTATITDLNSFTANIGTVTAGKMESSDGKMVVDLDNKFIKIEV